MAGKTYAAMGGVGGFELSAGNDTVAATTGTDSVGGTVTVGAAAGPTGDFIRVVTQVQTALSYSENTKSLLRSQSITSRAIIRQSINQVEISCLPTNVPENIEINIDNLEQGQSLSVSDIELKDKEVELLTASDINILTIQAPGGADEDDVEEAEVDEESSSEPDAPDQDNENNEGS